MRFGWVSSNVRLPTWQKLGKILYYKPKQEALYGVQGQSTPGLHFQLIEKVHLPKAIHGIAPVMQYGHV